MDIQCFHRVVALLPNEFSSHQFIEKYLQVFEADYISLLNPENGSIRRLHSEIGRFLVNNSNKLNIEKNGNSMDKNIKGYDSPNALWRKNGNKQQNNIIAVTSLILLYVIIIPYNLYSKSQHQGYEPNEKNIIVSETVIDTIEANRIFKEKYEPILLTNYQKGVEKKDKIKSLYLNRPTKVKTQEEILLLEQAYMAYSKTHPAYEKKTTIHPVSALAIFIPAVGIREREKKFTQDGIELTDRNVKKGKIKAEVIEYLSYYNTFLEDSLLDELTLIKSGWCEWLKQDEIPHKEIQVLRLNPNYRGLHYDNIKNLDILDYNEQNVGWEFLDISNGTYHEDSYPQKVKYYAFDEIPNYKVIEGDNKIKYVYDDNGNLKYVQKLTRLTNYKEFEDIKRNVYWEDYKNNKYNIKSQSEHTLQYLNKFLGTPNGLDKKKDLESSIFTMSAIESGIVHNFFRSLTNYRIPFDNEHEKRKQAGKEYQKLKKESDINGNKYIEQLTQDHKNEFGYIYMIDRLSDTSFRVLYLDATTLKPSYCAEVTYSTGKKPYTISYSTRLISMPSNIPPVIPQ